jgi:hypothetical protein
MFEVERIEHLPGTQPSFNLQLLTKDEIALFHKNGGNALGIQKEDGPLFCEYLHSLSVTIILNSVLTCMA